MWISIFEELRSFVFIKWCLILIVEIIECEIFWFIVNIKSLWWSVMLCYVYIGLVLLKSNLNVCYLWFFCKWE